MSKKQLIRNSSAGLIQFSLSAILSLLSVPIVINKLGMDVYGVFAMVSVIGNLNLLTNFGLNNALIVFLAKQGKTKESNIDIITNQVLMIFITSVFAILMISLHKFILINFFAIPLLYIKEASILFILLVLSNSLLLVGQVFTSIVDAQQKIYITNIAQFIYSILYSGGLILVVVLGGSLSEIGVVSIIASSLWFVVVWIVARNTWGKFSVGDLKKHFLLSAKKQLSYGLNFYFSGFLSFLFEPLSKILLSNFIGVSSVGIYDIAIRIRGLLSGIVNKALYPLFPYIAHTAATTKLRNHIYDFTKKILLLVIPLSVLVVFILPVIIQTWLNTNDEVIIVMSIVLTVSFILTSPTILPIYQYLNAKNKAKMNVINHAMIDVINLVVFMLLFKFCGIYAILISNLVAYIASFILYYYFQYRYLEISYKQEIGYYLKLIILALVTILLCSFVDYYLPTTLWDLPIYSVVILFSFIVQVRYYKLITKEDLETYLNTIPSIYRCISFILNLK